MKCRQIINYSFTMTVSMFYHIKIISALFIDFFYIFTFIIITMFNFFDSVPLNRVSWSHGTIFSNFIIIIITIINIQSLVYVLNIVNH